MEVEKTKLEIKKLKAEEVAKEIEKAVCKVLEKTRWVGFVESDEEGKVEIWGKKKFITELEYKDTEKILERWYSDVLYDIIEEVEKILEKYNLKETDYEAEILEPKSERFGQYGEWVWDYIDFKLGYGIEFDKEYSINFNLSNGKEYISIYYSDVTKRWHIEIGGILTERSEEVLLTEEEIKQLGLNPSDFESYFEA